MKKALLLLLLSFTSITFNAQTWLWARAGVSQTNTAESYGNAIDPNGNVIVAGWYNGQIIFGTYTLNSAPGQPRCFVIKYDPSGNILWVKNIIGNGELYSIACDLNGNVIVSGRYFSPTIVFGTFTVTNGSLDNAFIAKYDSNGNEMWATGSYATDGGVFGESVSTDSNGNVFLGGYFSVGTAVLFGAYTLTPTPPYFEAFLVKYDPNGNVLWATKPSGSGDEFLYSVTTDTNGNSYVTGSFTSPTLTVAALTLTNSGVQNTFIIKYGPAGNVIWALNPPSNENVGYDVSTDDSGNLYVTGSYSATSIVFGTNTLTNSGGNDYYLAKYNSSGNVLWARRGVGSNDEAGYSVTTTTGNVFVTGSFTSAIVLGTFSLSAANGTNDPMFIAQYDPSGNVVYATSLESGGDDYSSISIDKNCNLYLSGDYYTSPFIIGTNTLTCLGFESIFTAKLNFPCGIIPDAINAIDAVVFNYKIYPNPNAGSFNLQIDNEIINGKIIIYNSIGKVVCEKELVSGHNNISSLNLKVGFYYYSLVQNTEPLANGKILIE